MTLNLKTVTNTKKNEFIYVLYIHFIKQRQKRRFMVLKKKKYILISVLTGEHVVYTEIETCQINSI